MPIAEAIPFLDRVDVLAPLSDDVALHRLWVAVAVGDTAMLLAAHKRLATSTIEGSGGTWTFSARAADALERGSHLSPRDAAEIMRGFPRAARLSPAMMWFPNMLYAPFTLPSVSDSLFRALQGQGVYSGMEPAAVAARGYLAVTRGDFADGVDALASIEGSTAPITARLGAARVAAIGSWMGAVPIATADSALERARRSLGTLTGIPGAELAWLDGLVAIAAGDSARVGRAAAAITDTTARGRYLYQSVHALWRQRRTGNADSVRTLEDSAMQDGALYTPAIPLHRWAIAWQLVRAGDAARAEHYLQWADAIPSTNDEAAIITTFAPYNAYERGIAFQAAGDPKRAQMQFARFIESTDKPSPVVKQRVDDARARLAKLGGDVRR